MNPLDVRELYWRAVAAVGGNNRVVTVIMGELDTNAPLLFVAVTTTSYAVLAVSPVKLTELAVIGVGTTVVPFRV